MSTMGKAKTGARFGDGVTGNNGVSSKIRQRGDWVVTCIDKDGELKWVDEFKNRVMRSGLNYNIGVALATTAQISTWYVGLMQTGITVASGDSLASHAGWTEFIAYTGTNRIGWTAGAVNAATASTSNSASKANFEINATTAVGGAFLCSVQARGGTGGTLYAGGAFASPRTGLQSGDTLQITGTFTSADDEA